MSLLENFQNQYFYNRLAARQAGFSYCMEHLSKSENPLIIETGCARSPDAWEGDGQSTRIWDWVIQNKTAARAFSIDITPAHCDLARELSPNVIVVCQDSVQFLNKLDIELVSKIDLLYLDSYDWSMDQRLASSFHHFAELAAVWNGLPSGCLIMVDDRHTETLGKHVMIQSFMHQLGIEPVIAGYQIGWIKP